jgi:hypothetical protein
VEIISIIGALAMNNDSKASVIPYDPSIEGEKVERQRAFLPWKSNGCEHGIRPHLVLESGKIVEIGDRSGKPRKKPKAISSRQWEAV